MARIGSYYARSEWRGTKPYNGSISSRTPPGVSLATVGSISRTPATARIGSVGMAAFDPSGQTTTRILTISVTENSSAQNTTAVPKAFFGATLSGTSSEFPLKGGIVLGTIGKLPGTSSTYLEPTQDCGPNPNTPCYQWGASTYGMIGWVMAANNNGAELVYDFDGLPAWACGGHACTGLPTNLTYLSDFATAVATKFKNQIKYYETNNEVNNPSFWTGTCADLVLWNNIVYDAVKAADPAAIVGAPNMAQNTETYTATACGGAPTAAGSDASIWIQNFLQTRDRNGNFPKVDTLGVHTYAAHVANSPIGCDWATNKMHCAAQPLLNLYNSFRMVMNNNGMSSEPLLVTEGGFGKNASSSLCPSSFYGNESCLSPAEQVAYIGRWLVISASTWADGAGQLPNWYGYDVDWGSLDGSNGMNPQNALAYGQMETWIKGAAFSEQCHTGSPSTVFVCDFVSGTGKQSEIIFNDNNGATVQYTPPAWAGSYQPLLGSSTPISAGTVTVGDIPILLQ
jgi:hypothetical protein